MRVITGTAKGRRLFGPKSNRIRPALDKIKGAIFNILGNIEGLTVLDLFAGTGAVGIEALSRGAAHCTFVDSSQEAMDLIRRNLDLCRFERCYKIVKTKIPPFPPFAKGQAGAWPRRAANPMGLRSRIDEGGFDFIFVDPPYDKDLVNATLREIARENILAPGGMVVVEHSPREAISPDVGLTLSDRRKYGQTLVSFLGLPCKPRL